MKLVLALMTLTMSTSVFAGEVEQILGFTVDSQGINYQVRSGGCTNKKDFEVQSLETNPIQLKLVRNKPDFCEAFAPYGSTVKFTWAELGITDGSEVTIANPKAVIQVYRFQ